MRFRPVEKPEHGNASSRNTKPRREAGLLVCAVDSCQNNEADEEQAARSSTQASGWVLHDLPSVRGLGASCCQPSITAYHSRRLGVKKIVRCVRTMARRWPVLTVWKSMTIAEALGESAPESLTGDEAARFPVPPSLPFCRLRPTLEHRLLALLHLPEYQRRLRIFRR